MLIGVLICRQAGTGGGLRQACKLVGTYPSVIVSSPENRTVLN